MKDHESPSTISAAIMLTKVLKQAVLPSRRIGGNPLATSGIVGIRFLSNNSSGLKPNVLPKMVSVTLPLIELTNNIHSTRMIHECHAFQIRSLSNVSDRYLEMLDEPREFSDDDENHQFFLLLDDDGPPQKRPKQKQAANGSLNGMPQMSPPLPIPPSASRSSPSKPRHPAHHWEHFLQQLKTFQQTYGHTRVPQAFFYVDKDNPSTINPLKLGQWVMRYRAEYKRYQAGHQSLILTDEKIQQLSELGFVWDAQEQKWHTRYLQLKDYKDTHGNCLVKKDNSPPGLCRWVEHQRHIYHRARSGQTSTLVEQRVRKLNELGFVWGVEFAHWMEMFHELHSYCGGKFTYPLGNDCPLRLKRWVIYHRSHYRLYLDGKQSNLTKEKVEKLESIGFDVEHLRRKEQRLSWQDCFQELCQFHAQNGHSKVPQPYPPNQKLSSWVARQRREYTRLQEGKPSKLTEDNVEALRQVGFVFDLQSTSWNRWFSKWKEHRDSLLRWEQEGRIAERPRKTDALIQWIGRQRHIYRLVQEGSPSSVFANRVAILEAEGFPWESSSRFRPVHWKKRLEELKRYKDLNGDCHLKKNRPGYSLALCNWFERLRAQYRSLMAGGKSLLTVEQIRELDELGFPWHSRFEKNSNEMLIALQQYRKAHGDCLVPKRYKPNMKLSRWVHKQRKSYANGTLRKDLISRLAKEGFDWDPESKLWNQMLVKFSAFVSDNGHGIVPARDLSFAPLWKWAAEQRRQREKLSDEQIESLNQLGFVWDENEATWKEMVLALRRFRAEHGHCGVPQIYAPYPSLAVWVRQQRQQHELFKRGEESTLTDIKLQELENEGFIWDESAREWEVHYEELVNFASANGHCSVPLWYPSNPPLGHWVKMQQRQLDLMRKGSPNKLSTEHARLLEKIGL